jgi:hypothetical protein
MPSEDIWNVSKTEETVIFSEEVTQAFVAWAHPMTVNSFELESVVALPTEQPFGYT